MGREQHIKRVGFIDFSDSQPATRIDSLGSWHWQPAADRNAAWIEWLSSGELRVWRFFGSGQVVDSPRINYTYLV